MKLNGIEIGPDYPNFKKGAVPGIKCVVDLQVGERYGQKVEITLTPDETRAVVELAVEKAMSHLMLDKASIVIVGTPGEDEEPAAAGVAAAPAEVDPL